MSETVDPRQRFLFSTLPGLLSQAYDYVRSNPLQATADVAQVVSPGGSLQDALAGSEQISRSALRGDIGGMVGGAGAVGAGLLGAIPLVGALGRAGGAAMRGASEAAPVARAVENLPSYRVMPEVNKPFDEWIDALYAPNVRGLGNIVRHPSVGYRGVSDAELQAAVKEGKFKPASGNDLFIEYDPERYVGGGAYGAKKGGAIVQFSTEGIPVREIDSYHVKGLKEKGVNEIPLSNVSNIWQWSPETKTHNLLSQEDLNTILRRFGLLGTIGAGAAMAGAQEMQQ
jgi:hypothetical protein